MTSLLSKVVVGIVAAIVGVVIDLVFSSVVELQCRVKRTDRQAVKLIDKIVVIFQALSERFGHFFICRLTSQLLRELRIGPAQVSCLLAK